MGKFIQKLIPKWIPFCNVSFVWRIFSWLRPISTDEMLMTPRKTLLGMSSALRMAPFRYSRMLWNFFAIKIHQISPRSVEGELFHANTPFWSYFKCVSRSFEISGFVHVQHLPAVLITALQHLPNWKTYLSGAEANEWTVDIIANTTDFQRLFFFFSFLARLTTGIPVGRQKQERDSWSVHSTFFLLILGCNWHFYSIERISLNSTLVFSFKCISEYRYPIWEQISAYK